MELKPEQLVGQIHSRALAPVYLIAGPETLRVLEAADAVRARARTEGVSEREIFDTGARDFSWDALTATFHAPSLFSTRRLVELRLHGGKPGREGAEVISAYCAAPPDDVILLVTAEEWSKSHHGKWADAVSRCGVLSVAWTVKPHELPEWIERRLHSRGIRADHETVQNLADRVEGNLLAAAQEIDKLALLAPDGDLDIVTMQLLVADLARYDVFRLIEVTLSGQTAQVSHMLTGLRGEGEAVAGLMPMITRELWRAATLARVQARRGNLAAEMKAQGLWESRQAPFRRALQRHPAPVRWEGFLRFASRIDRAVKGRGSGDPWIMLERLLLAIADAPAVRLLAT
ncbi:MAG: DNA polymerase III subunit delta [Xanthomonadaceae bacterium]|jgi:DNA polymerase-3 subunit delta|nr:DNA polymerase III subunit delta [Xanthomonadaceae bacterium]